MEDLKGSDRMRMVETALNWDGDIIFTLSCCNTLLHERQRVAKEIISCKHDTVLKDLNAVFDMYNDQIKKAIGVE